MSKLITIIRLSFTMIAACATLSAHAQSTTINLDLNSAKPKYSLHLTGATKVINTKKDVSDINYKNRWQLSQNLRFEKSEILPDSRFTELTLKERS